MILTTWKEWILLLAPFIYSPLLIFIGTKEATCGYVVLLMGTYWCTEPIPIAVTALLPVVLLPILGLSTTEDACTPYLKETNMLFLACLMFALAVEKSNFHIRIALRVILTGGNDFKWLLLGFMLTSMFLAMFIINTAATAMMLPIADAIIDEIFPCAVDTHQPSDTCQRDSEAQLTVIKSNGLSSDSEPDVYKINKEAEIRQRKLKKLLYLSIAYSSTIGGTSTLTSNGPNLVFKFIVEDLYADKFSVDYATWFIFCAPGALISVLICWFIYKLLFIGDDYKLCQSGAPLDVIRRKYSELGPLTFHEVSILILFILLVLLWMLRNPHFMPGWINLFSEIKPKDATAAMLIVFLLFVIPAKPLSAERSPSLLDWETVQKRLPWGIIILRGGGFSMAEAVTTSGLSTLLGNQLAKLDFISVFGIIVVLSVMTAFLTEFASNSATATILLPIAGQMAYSLKVNPLIFLIPITLSCSFAFILPVGTPANALVFAHAKLVPSDMLVPGLLTQFVCVFVMIINLYTVGYPLFNL